MTNEAMQSAIQATSFLRLARVKERVGLSGSTIYKMIREGSFPSPVKLGQRASGWRSCDLDAWANSRGASHA